MTAITIRRRSYPLPNPITDADDLDRIDHRDIRSLLDDQLVAERVLVAEAYAHAVAHRSRAVVYVPDARNFIPAVDWLAERLQRIDAEIARRKGPRR